MNHPNICSVYDIGEQDGRAFIVRELLEGLKLKVRVAGRPLPIETVISLGIEIADALYAAHSAQIIHRDIKSGNIFVTKREHAKILDFGVAKSSTPASGSGPDDLTQEVRDLTTDGAAIGTVTYMSTEQVEGKELDPRTDVFSFRIVLYEMATGKAAFERARQERPSARFSMSSRAHRRASMQPSRPASKRSSRKRWRRTATCATSTLPKSAPT